MKKLILTLLFLTASMSYSQTLQTVSPTYGAENVPVFPIIILEASKNIDTTEFILNSPYDTLGTPQIYLINSDYYYSLPDSLHQIFSLDIEMTVTMNDKIQINVLYDQLEYLTDYTIIVKDLPLRDAADTTTTYLDTVFVDYFKVAPSLPYLAHFSPAETGRFINCKDTVKFYLRGPLDTSFVDIDTLLRIYEVLEYIPDTLAVDSIMIVPDIQDFEYDYIINDDLDVISIYKDGGFMTGGKYFYSFEISKFYGDTLYDKSSYFNIARASYIQVLAQAADTSLTLPDSLQTSVHKYKFNLRADDTLTVYAHQGNENFIFSHWESEDFPYLDGETNSIIDLYTNCETYKYDAKLFAIYKTTCIDTVEFTWNSVDSIKKVSMYGYLDSISPTKYTVYKHKDAFVHVELDTNVMLKPMVFPDSLIHEQIGQQSFTFRTSLMPCDTFFVINLEPELASPPPPCDKFKVCINIYDEKSEIIGNQNLENIITVVGFNNWTITGNKISECKEFDIPPDQRTFNLDLSIKTAFQDCYQFSYIEAGNFRQGNVKGGNFFMSIDEDFEFDKDEGPCELIVDIYLVPKKFRLEVNYVLPDDFEWPLDVENQVQIVQYDNNGVPIYPHFRRVYVGNKLKRYQHAYEYACGSQAIHYPVVKNNDMYDYLQWLKAHEVDPVNIDPEITWSQEGSDPHPQTLTFTMDMNRKIYYRFQKTDFYAKTIKFYMDNDNTSKTWKFPGTEGANDDWPYLHLNENESGGMSVLIKNIANGDNYPNMKMPFPDEDNIPAIIRNHHRRTVKFFVEFSHDVDESSLGTSQQNPLEGLTVFDLPSSIRYNLTYRNDWYPTQSYFYKDGAGKVLTAHKNVVEFITFVNNNGFRYGPHASEFKLHLGTNIKRESDGVPLKKPVQVIWKSRNPGLYVYLDKYYHTKNNDNCWGFTFKPDVFSHSAIAVYNDVASAEPLLTSTKGNESNKEDDLNKNTIKGIDELMLASRYLKSNQYIYFGTHFIDEGTGDSYGELSKAITEFIEAASCWHGDTKLCGGGKALAAGIALVMKAATCNDRTMGILNLTASEGEMGDRFWAPVEGTGYLYWGARGPLSMYDNLFTGFEYGAYPVFKFGTVRLRMVWVTGDF